MMKRLFVVIAILLFIGAAATFVTGWVLAAPIQRPIGSPPPDLNAEPISFASDSGATVHGWWCPTASGRCTVLLLPGIRANRLSMVDRARFLRRADYSVLLIDLQATGETKGDHITFGWKESRDVIAAVDFIHQMNPSDRVAVIGSSLGGAAALLATPPLKVDAMILEAVYPTIEIATENRLKNYLGPFGHFAAPLLLTQLRGRLGISTSDLRPLDHIANVNCPVLIVSGARDPNTTPGDTQMLFSNAKFPKQLWLVPDARHVDLHEAGRRAYETRVLEFLAQMTESK